MNKCDYCGEYKKVRREMFGLNHFELRFPTYSFNYICEDCDKAKNIVEKIKKEKLLELKEKEKKDWIKKRDKLLKENKKWLK